MDIELIKRMMDACYQAKRIRDMLPPLPDGVASSYIQYLDIIEKLEKQGILVVMTREGEDDLSDPGAVNAKVQDLQRRVQLIHEKKPDCVISIHQNSYPDAAVKGAQVFYYTDSKEGEKLALCMQAALVAGLDPANHRKAKGNKTYYMLKKTDAVLVICECGFLSNPEEEALLRKEEWQREDTDEDGRDRCGRCFRLCLPCWRLIWYSENLVRAIPCRTEAERTAALLHRR